MEAAQHAMLYPLQGNKEETDPEAIADANKQLSNVDRKANHCID